VFNVAPLTVAHQTRETAVEPRAGPSSVNRLADRAVSRRSLNTNGDCLDSSK
jgi:hypothetical protein